MKYSHAMKSNLSSALASTIKELRLSQNLSQEELADLCELDRTYISGVERNTRNPTIKSIQKIIVALEISEKDFLDLVKENLNG